MAQRGLWNIAKQRLLEDMGALPEEEGDLFGDYHADDNHYRQI